MKHYRIEKHSQAATFKSLYVLTLVRGLYKIQKIIKKQQRSSKWLPLLLQATGKVYWPFGGLLYCILCECSPIALYCFSDPDGTSRKSAKKSRIELNFAISPLFAKANRLSHIHTNIHMYILYIIWNSHQFTCKNSFEYEIWQLGKNEWIIFRPPQSPLSTHKKRLWTDRQTSHCM